MSLFTSLFPSKPSEVPSGKKELLYLMGIGKFEVELIGENQYQAVLEDIAGPRKPQGVKSFETATLKLEDKNAVRVEILRQPVGYVSLDSARFVRQQLIARGLPKGVVQCPAVIHGGWVSSDGRKGPYKVWLDLPIQA
jgi:hypothetical protein